MAASRGKWIRIECDNKGIEWHPGNTVDIAGDEGVHTYADLWQMARKLGWKKIKGKWQCPFCINETKKKNRSTMDCICTQNHSPGLW